MRRIIKLLIMYLSTFLYHNKKSKIIFYHDICGAYHYKDKDTGLDMGTPFELFKRHIQVIRNNGFHITDKISKNNGQVMICFDDGFRGIYDNRDFFIKEGLKPTVFLAVSLIGHSGYLTKDEIKELQKDGFIFQSHAWSHKDLSSFSQKDLMRELYHSKIFLEDLLGEKVDEICFPIGYFSQLVLDECKKIGYKTMYSSIPGSYCDFNIADGLRTRNLVQFSSPLELKLILLGGNEIIKNRYVRMHWRR